MTSPRSPANGPTARPPLIAEFVEAANSFDLERLMVSFADDALVNVQLRDYWGKAAIRRWAERDIIGEKLMIAVTKVVKHYETFLGSAEIDGNFDRRRFSHPLGRGF